MSQQKHIYYIKNIKKCHISDMSYTADMGKCHIRKKLFHQEKKMKMCHIIATSETEESITLKSNSNNHNIKNRKDVNIRKRRKKKKKCITLAA